MELRGEIDLILLAEEYANRGMRNQRLITIQTLANTTKTGSYDPNTVNSLENNLLAKGIIYQTGEHSLTAKDIQALTARYGEYPEGGKKFTHFLENGGDMIFTGAEILAGGVLDRLKDIEESLDDVEELIPEEKLESIENIEELISEEDIFGQGVQGEGVGIGGERVVQADAFDYYMDLVEHLDVSTKRNTATFYSGEGNRALAEEFARINEKVTLETTPGGPYLDSLRLFEEDRPLTNEEALQVWSRLSERYAQGASGNTYGFVNGSWSGSIFNTVEYPELLNNPNVTNIFTEFMK